MQSDGTTWTSVTTTAPPWDAIPSNLLTGTVRLARIADLKVQLRDVADERRRVWAAMVQLQERAVSLHRGVHMHPFFRSFDEAYPEDGPGVLLQFTLPGASADDRRRVLLNLLEFLGDHEDALVRDRVSIRVR